MSVLGRIFGTEKAIDALTSGVDSVIFTPQERAAQFERVLKLYEPFKLAQRLLALLFCPVYLVAWVVVFTMRLSSVDVPADAVQMLNGDMGNVVMIIATFYFGGGVINSIRGK